MNQADKIKTMFMDDVDNLASQPELFVKDPSRDFTRNRKLSAKDVLLFPILRERDCTNMELLKYFEHSTDTPSISAYFQQRSKLLPDTYRYLLSSFNSHFEPTLYMNKYILTAVDGSGFNLFYNPKDPVTYIEPNKSSPKGHNEIHVTAAYQITDRIYSDAVIQPSPQKNEYAALCDLIDRCDTSRGIPLFIADRGFPSYNVFAHSFEKGVFFLIRAKDLYINRLLSDDLPSESAEYDVTVKRIVIRTKRKRFLASLENPWDLYRYIDPNTRFDFIEANAEGEYTMTLRVVRVKIPDGGYENLITNLPADEFDLPALCDLYHLRWSIENSYRELKHAVGAQDFNCRTFEYIVHEVWARLLLYNFCSRITALVAIEKAGSKHVHQVNYSMAIKNSHTFLRQKPGDPPIKIIDLIGKYTEPIRPGRNFARNRRFQPPMKFTYRH